IQVAYLAYPGTMGADFMDYIIADPVVLPLHQQEFYAEKNVQLPESYQVTDPNRRIPEMPTRREMGLSETPFVFCCFNNNDKLTAAMFDVWMRLLKRVPDSVLWLLRSNATAEENLRKEAA